jgi:ubiquinone/menaquinone biosynthesis C-methylase UbiE
MNFREFEHAGWEQLPQDYHKGFAQLTTQAIPALLEAVQVRRETRLLDVATGPGYVAAAAAERGANVVGMDFAEAMVAEARRRYPKIRFQEGDAEQLPFPDGTFDAVTMNFGMLHLANPEAAAGEARRVLREGGRFAFTVWAKPEQARGLGVVLQAIQRHGNPNVSLPSGPPFFRFSEPAESLRMLEAAGFALARAGIVPQTWCLDSADDLFEFMMRSTVRTGALLRAQSREALDAIRADVRQAALSCRRSDGKIAIPMPAMLSSAAKGSA